jgi:integrase
VSGITDTRLAEPSELTLADLVALWLAHCETIGRSPNTIRKYKSIANSVVVPALGHLPVTQLTPRHLDGLYADLVSQGKKATTVRRVHALVGSALHQAERWDILERNVARRSQPPEVYAEEITAPSVEDVRRLLTTAEASDPTMAALLTLAVLTGARRGELCSLRWSDFDEDRRVLRIARSIYECEGGGWSEKSTKNRRVRRVALDDVAVAVLRRRKDSARTTTTHPNDRSFVFSPHRDGSEPMRPDRVSRLVNQIARDAGVTTTLQGLRHFSATQLVAGGHDPKTVAGRLGHVDAGLTLRTYSHVLPQRDRDAAASLGRVVDSFVRTAS